ncbi:outer membrane beta-barrel protein, partial [Oleiphilus sp. HI0080]
LLFVLFISSSVANAEPAAYAELAGNVVLQSVDEKDFQLGATELKGGLYVHQLISLEAFVSQGVVDDTDNNLNQAVGLGYGVGARFESPSRRGTKAFILLGFSSHELELKREDTSQSLSTERFEGFAYGVGLQEQLFDADSQWYVSARWQRHYSSGQIKIDTVGAALRYAF